MEGRYAVTIEDGRSGSQRESRSEVVTLEDVTAPPIPFSYYHYFCFTTALTHALERSTPGILGYLATRQATYELAADARYPFVALRHRCFDPDPYIGWRSHTAIDADVLREVIGSRRMPLIALRDLFDVASFPQHFGRSHHPNWYVIRGYDLRRRTVDALAEVGGRPTALNARKYEPIELTDREADFTARRVMRTLPGAGTYPFVPIMEVESRVDEQAVRSAWRALLESMDQRRTAASDKVSRIRALCLSGERRDLGPEDFDREEFLFRTWANRVRPLQVLSAKNEQLASLRGPLQQGMNALDQLITSAIFWGLKSARHSIPSRQRAVASGQTVVQQLDRLLAVDAEATRVMARL